MNERVTIMKERIKGVNGIAKVYFLVIFAFALCAAVLRLAANFCGDLLQFSVALKILFSSSVLAFGAGLFLFVPLFDENADKPQEVQFKEGMFFVCAMCASLFIAFVVGNML